MDALFHPYLRPVTNKQTNNVEILNCQHVHISHKQ